MEKKWEEYYQQKVIAPQQLEKLIAGLRKKHKTIATLNGSFDLFHAGHLEILFEASKAADILIVALNSDSSIKQYKSEKRPIISLQYRLQMIAAIEFINYVTWFSETDPRKILEIIKPDFHINGSEYGSQCIEAKTVKKHGGSLKLVKLIPGLSTSDIINKILIQS